MRLIIVSGLSGSGKSVALDALEDLGFYCIDNIPAALLGGLINQMIESQDAVYDNMAVGVDARNTAADLDSLPDLLHTLKDQGLYSEALFLHAEDEILFKTSLNTSSPVRGCRKELHNAFMSLIANAAEALEAEGEIYLTADEKPGLINIYVQEGGIGIHKNVVDNIFDPFFTTKGDGHKGLGLSLARAVIERHGGKIGVTRHEAGGTTFHVKLPLEHSPFNTDDRPKKRSIKDARILLMGGQNILINLLCRFLSSKPLHITRVDSYGECFKALKGGPFHLMLVDQSKSSEKTAWLIGKVRHTHPDLPIALFNVSNGDDAELSPPSGADLVIPRPLHLGRFYSSIYRLMTEGKASQTHS